MCTQGLLDLPCHVSKGVVHQPTSCYRFVPTQSDCKLLIQPVTVDYAFDGSATISQRCVVGNSLVHLVTDNT